MGPPCQLWWFKISWRRFSRYRFKNLTLWYLGSEHLESARNLYFEKNTSVDFYSTPWLNIFVIALDICCVFYVQWEGLAVPCSLIAHTWEGSMICWLVVWALESERLGFSSCLWDFEVLWVLFCSFQNSSNQAYYVWLHRGVRVHTRCLMQFELRKWKPLLLLMTVFPRVCPLWKGDLRKPVCSPDWASCRKLPYMTSSRWFLLIKESSDKTVLLLRVVALGHSPRRCLECWLTRGWVCHISTLSPFNWKYCAC